MCLLEVSEEMFCCFNNDTQLWPPPSPRALPQFCSLVETDVGLLLLANTVAGLSGTQAA